MSPNYEKLILPFCPISSNCAYWHYLYLFLVGGGVDVKLWCSIYYNGAARKGNAALLSSPLVHCSERYKVLFLFPLGVGGDSRIWSQEIYGYWLHCAEAMGTAIKYSCPSLEVVCWIIWDCNETVSARNDVCMRHHSGKFRERVAYQCNFSSAKVEGCLGLRSVWRCSSTSVPVCNHGKGFRISINMTL